MTRPTWRTPERIRLFRSMWASGTPAPEVRAAVAALPGPSLPKTKTSVLAYEIGAVRFRKPPVPVCALSPEQQIAEYIARHGVTRCPPAAVAETSATIDAASRAAIRAHDDALAAGVSTQWTRRGVTAVGRAA